MNCINKRCAKSIPDGARYCPWCGKSQNARRTRRANGEGSIYQLPSGKWKVDATISYGLDDADAMSRVRVTGSYPTKAEALAALPELKKAKLAESRVNQSQRKTMEGLTVAQAWDIYQRSKSWLKLSKSQQDKLTLARRRVSPLEDVPIPDLTLDEMQNLIDMTANTFYPCKDMKTVFSHCYKVAIRRDLVLYNKALYIELPELHEGDRKPFTRQDVAAFLADWQAGCRFAGYVLILCYCGLRPIELMQIELKNIHLDEHYMIGGAKTDTGRNRIIPLCDLIQPIVAYFTRVNKVNLLEMSRDTFYARFHDLIERLGVSSLTPYSCRHFFMTEMARAEVQAGVITAVGGHADYDTTLRYTHIPTADLVAAANKMASNIEAKDIPI